MTSDPIRETLRTLPRKNIGVPHGFARIGRGDVEASTLDVAEVEDWLRAHDGKIEVMPTRGQQVGGGPAVRRGGRKATSYLVPLDEL